MQIHRFHGVGQRHATEKQRDDIFEIVRRDRFGREDTGLQANRFQIIAVSIVRFTIGNSARGRREVTGSGIASKTQ